MQCIRAMHVGIQLHWGGFDDAPVEHEPCAVVGDRPGRSSYLLLGALCAPLSSGYVMPAVLAHREAGSWAPCILHGSGASAWWHRCHHMWCIIIPACWLGICIVGRQHRKLLLQCAHDCRCRGQQNQSYFGQVRLLFHMTRLGKLQEELFALMRWFETDGTVLAGPRLSCLVWATEGRVYEVVPADSLRRLVVLQPHPDPEMWDAGFHVHNHFFDGPL